MRLLKEIRIGSFRSLRNVTIADLDSYVSLIGLNSSGESNVLRALNLYFNDYLDEDHTPLSMERDFPRSLAKSKERKLVSVGVTFDLSTGYLPRNTEAYLSTNSYTDQIAVQREWSISPLGQGILQDTLKVGPTLSELSEVPVADRAFVYAFVRSIHYRYVPNHVRPADFLRSEVQPLRNSLITNLRRTNAYKNSSIAETMAELSNVAKTMLLDTSSKVSAGNLGRGIGADLPAEFADLAFQVALQTETPSGFEPTELQGSGSQSFTLLHVLDLLDRTERGQGFGWKKASVWALEEPESFLHAGLKARFAQDLAQYARDPKRQVLASTHSEDFVRVGDDAWMATIEASQTTITKMSARDALGESSRRRITSFVHPLMEFPDHPIVIVEGKFDGVHLRAAMRTISLRPGWKLTVMSEIDTAYKPGGTAMSTYLLANQAVINSRSLTAPIVVLRDWEDAGGSVNLFARPLEGHTSSTVICCPVSLSNPDLDSTFRGIERFLATDLIRSTIPVTAMTRPASQDLPLGIREKSAYDQKFKPALAKAVADGSDPGDHMQDLAKWLDEQVTASLNRVPAQLFL